MGWVRNRSQDPTAWWPLFSKRLLVFVFVFVFFSNLSASFAETPEELLYYENESPFETNSRWEARPLFGLDYSDPYAILYSLGAGTSYSVDRTVSLGLEFTTYFTQIRASTRTLDDVLGRFGYRSDVVVPKYSVIAVGRYTPLSGLVNFLSRNVLLADLSLVVHLGTAQYQLGFAPVVGTGVEIHIGLTRTFGIAGTFLWEAHLPPQYKWESRVGVRLSPTWRF